MIRVWVVSSSTALRAGLRMMIQADDRLEVNGESRSLAEGVETLLDCQVLLLAGDLPSVSELKQAVDFINEPPALLWMTDEVRSDPEFTRLPWRAWGIISLDTSGSELNAAIQSLSEGLLVGTPFLIEKALRQPGQDSPVKDNLDDPLTARELEVLQSLAQGLPNKQIALALGISEHTAKFHISSIYAKLGVTNRTEAVRSGIQRGLVVV